MNRRTFDICQSFIFTDFQYAVSKYSVQDAALFYEVRNSLWGQQWVWAPFFWVISPRSYMMFNFFLMLAEAAQTTKHLQFTSQIHRLYYLERIFPPSCHQSCYTQSRFLAWPLLAQSPPCARGLGGVLAEPGRVPAPPSATFFLLP